VRPPHESRHWPQLTRPRSKYSEVVLLRRAIGTLRSRRCWAASQVSSLMRAGTGTAIHSSVGAGC
jgi:hypothetical protein